MITLENREPALRYYAIPVSVGGGEKHHLGASARNAKGERALRVHARVYPTTLTLAARGTEGSTSEPLPESYAQVPAIAAAIAAKKLVKATVAAPAKKAAPSAPEPAAAGEKE